MNIDIDCEVCNEDLFQLVYDTLFCYQNNLICVLSPFSLETMSDSFGRPKMIYIFGRIISFTT